LRAGDFFLAIGIFFGAVLVFGRDASDTQILVAVALPIIYFIALGLALWWCSGPVISGPKGLLAITAYMSVGIGGFSMLIAIPVVIVSIVVVLGIAMGGLVGGNRPVAQQQFQRLVSFIYKYRMYQ